MTPSLLKLPTEIRLNIYDILCPASVDIRLYDGFGSSEQKRILAAIYRKSRTQSIIHHRQQDWHPRMTSREDFLMPRSIDSLLKTCRLLNVEVGMHVYRKLDVRMWLLLGSRGSYRQFCHQDRRLVVPTAPVMLHPGARLMRCLSIDLIGIGCLRNNCWYHDWDGFSLVKRQKVFALAELLNWCVNLEKLNIWFHGNEKSSSIKKAGSNPEQHSLSCGKFCLDVSIPSRTLLKSNR